MSSISIDGQEYPVETLNETAKAQLASIQAVDRRLSDLKEQTAILQTARIGYVAALRESCLAGAPAAVEA